MNQADRSRPTRVAIIQSRLAPFRIAFFNRLGKSGEVNLTVFSSDRDAAGKNAKPLGETGFQWRTLCTTSLGGGRCTIQWGLPWAFLAGGFDVIVAEARLGLALNPLILVLCRLTGKRFLWWTCGWERSETEAVSRFKRIVRRMLFACSHGGIAYSTLAQKYLISLGVHPDHTWVAQNSLETESLLAIESEICQDRDWITKGKAKYGADGRIILLFVGKMTRTKNLDLLLRAFAEIERRRKDVVLWIVGDGPDRKRQEGLAAELQLTAASFLGEISEPHTINSIYMAADVFVLPGTGGLALNQAMTFGKPVVVSKADGTEEDLVTDGKNGLYFQPNNTDDLAAKLEMLLDDAALRIRMGKQSRDHILTSINMRNMVNCFCNAVFDRRTPLA